MDSLFGDGAVRGVIKQCLLCANYQDDNAAGQWPVNLEPTSVPSPRRLPATCRYALASIWENDGTLVVYDAATFAEVKRIPMAKPSGKYNVYNKTTRSAGTSH